jgi:hypothetical protein
MNRPRHPLSRRHLLQGLGLTGLGLGLGLGRGRPAVAAPGDIPRRIIFYYGSGMLYDFWEPTASMGKPAPEEYDFQLGELHAPLQPYKDRLIYVDGIGMVSEEVDPGEKGNAHNQGAKHALAPYDSSGTDLPGGVSIDQFIAKALNEPQAVTPHQSLVLQAAGWTNELTLFSGAVASGPGALVPGIWDPRQAYDKIFGMFQGGQDPQVIDQLRAQRAAVFNLAADDFTGLQSRVGTADADRLQIHLDLLRDLEERLKLQDSLTCTKPEPLVTPPGNFEQYDSQYFAGNFNLSADMHSQLITAALACDQTRVVTLEMQYPGDSDFDYTAGQFDTVDAHDLVHKINDKNSPQYQIPEAVACIRKMCTIEAQKLANLLGMLAAVPEGDGKSLLDHTIVLYCGQIAYGSHDLARLPWIVIGDADGYFKTGRYIKYAANPNSQRGLPHNNLYVSLANAMGIDIDTFGNPAACTGPLDGLTG